MFKALVKELSKWLKSEQTDLKFSNLICKYLNHHREVKMQSLLHSTQSRYKSAAVIHDKLGWDNFMEGHICATWVKHRSDDIQDRKLKRSEGEWARGLMSRLFQITHKQWTYQKRNRASKN